MNRRMILCIIGLLLTVAPSASAKLYERVQKQVEAEHSVDTVDEEVTSYLHAIFGEEWKISVDDVKSLLTGKQIEVCGNNEPGEPGKSLSDCSDLSKRIAIVARNENRIRSLGRTLQATASSYELPISELPNRSITLSTDLRGILNIWGAGSGSVQSTITGARIRIVSVEADQFRDVVGEVGSAISSLKGDDQIGAVWRYQYGVRLIQGKRVPRFPAPVIDGEKSKDRFPERQYLYKRWDGDNEDLESALTAVWDKLLELVDDPDLFDPPLSGDETAFISFPTELLTSALPENIIIWARIDGDRYKNNPYGDAGLQWDIPMEPVFPGLVKDGENSAILGGTYPPEPILQDGKPRDGSGLCTNPVTLRGYLCRSAVHTLDLCPDAQYADPDKISLVNCEKEKTERYTIAGPDVCREIHWAQEGAFDAKTQCKINLQKDNCNFGDPNDNSPVKAANGVINVCAKNPAGMTRYSIYHDLAHAAQACNVPSKPPYEEEDGDAWQIREIRERNAAMCCARETEAFQTQCTLMEQDGAFDEENLVNGIPVNAETCAESLANDACSTANGFAGCYVSRPYSNQFVDRMKQLAGGRASDAPKMEQRVKQFIEEISATENVCKPGNLSLYKNRIGNNLCFLGRCVEESSESHRITGSTTPSAVGTAESPWDNPAANAPLGNILLNPPFVQTTFQSYRPALLVRTMEEALCQAQGFPPLTPPILCAVEGARQLSSYRDVGTSAVAGILGQAREQIINEQDLLILSSGLGSRVGTNMYSEYLVRASKAFSDILTMAADLLEEMTRIRFPIEACPLGAGIPSAPAEPTE